MIDHKRRCTLADQLLHATRPSDEPDDRYRPSHWSDRIYYLLKQSGLSQQTLSQCSFDAAPRFVATDSVREAASNWPLAFYELEKIVEAEIQARSLP